MLVDEVGDVVDVTLNHDPAGFSGVVLGYLAHLEVQLEQLLGVLGKEELGHQDGLSLRRILKNE